MSKKILFIHQNFPGQFKELAPALAARGDQVVAMVMKKSSMAEWRKVKIVPYVAQRGSTAGIHPWVVDLETKAIRGEACYHAALKLRDEGFTPDLIVAHPGWGESLFLKDVWPNARLVIYCEYFYQTTGGDIDFDPEFPPIGDESCKVRMKNLNNLAHFDFADAGIAPTHWQASTFPERFRSKITVIHDGIDTRVIKPYSDVRLSLKSGLELTKDNEVVTFVSRNLEPYRGFHVFMRALPELLRRRPNAYILIVGGDDVSYGRRPENSASWREAMTNEIRSAIPAHDWSRIKFVGRLAYPDFIALLQLSRVHVYLTYPFVLSWSLLEAMSAGCAIVGGATAPVQEVIRHAENGLLVDFFDEQAILNSVCELLEDAKTRDRIGMNARDTVVASYDLKDRCLPSQISWIDANLH
ncbi:MAG: glycosyltransferase family 4 protein [Burkholderiales bacterium]|nr:glycosyltransferase family 4 protein [Burkholderiales bacterium]